MPDDNSIINVHYFLGKQHKQIFSFDELPDKVKKRLTDAIYIECIKLDNKIIGYTTSSMDDVIFKYETKNSAIADVTINAIRFSRDGYEATFSAAVDLHILMGDVKLKRIIKIK